MEYEFRLKGGRSFRLANRGNLAVELAASLAGVKDVIHLWTGPGDEAFLDGVCEAFGFESLVFERREGGRSQVMIGPDRRRLDEAAALWFPPKPNPGKALDYPPCCASSYARWMTRVARGGAPDVIREAAGRTKAKRPWSFLLNDAFYLYSRRWATEDAARRDEIAALNPSLDLDALNVLPWHPCRYDCPESLRRARWIWKTMTTAVPALAAALKETLPRTILFWDWHRFAVLNGTAARYRGLRAPFSLLEPALSARVLSGDEVRVTGRRWTVLSAGKLAGSWSDPPALLRFE